MAAWKKGHRSNHDLRAAARKGKAASPWRHDVVRSPNSRKLREQWAKETTK